MLTVVRTFTLLACLAIVSACATNQFSGTKSLAEGVTLKNSRLYVYSFLDIRDTQFGPNLLTEFDAQLTRELSSAAVTAKVLRFKESETGRYATISNSQMTVPIKDTIKNNAENERALGADFRLIIFPSQMTLSGAWTIYDVRWDLYETKTGKLVWATTSHGKHMNAWKRDEEPQSRAKTIVDGIMAELKNSNLI
jgi:hypothetical protein